MNPTITETDDLEPDDQANHFVHYVIQQCQTDRTIAARLRRALHPSFEYLSWDTFALFGIALENTSERLPYAFIAATIAQLQVQKNGTFALGRALALAFTDGKKSELAQMRLRRLLACSTLVDVQQVLRSVLPIMQSQHPLDYVVLLKELLVFMMDPQAIKAQWAQQFYAHETFALSKASS